MIEEEYNEQKIILIVDDMPENLRLLAKMLEKSNYRVKKAINGQIALNAAQNDPPDLILLDINMPEMDGYEVCQRLKANNLTKQIPIIFISALKETTDKVKAFKMGAVDYISKPFYTEEVLARVENQLKIHFLNEKIQQQAKNLADKNKQLEREIKERRRAEFEVRLLLATTQAISRAENFQSALKVVLSLVCTAIGWDFAEAWIPSTNNSVLISTKGWYASELRFYEFRQESYRLTFTHQEGLVGRIWSSKKPEWIENISSCSVSVYSRSQLAVKVGLKAAFGIPILLENEVIAILVFYNKNAVTQQQHLLELIHAVATQLAALMYRKQTQEALQLAEQRYHHLVENAIEGIFQTTPNGKYISANPALAKIYGYDSPEELIASLTDVSQQLYVDANRRREFVEAMEANDAVEGFESLVNRQDGQKIWVSENARAVRDYTGKLLYYEGTVSDITERKIAQEALKFQQKQTEELLLNILPAAIADRIKQGEVNIADSFEDVSVLFADLVGFTEFGDRKSPAELVKVLNLIFSEFDQLAQKHGLEKIKTIGDAYMVVGGLPKPDPDCVEKIAEMALDMQFALAKLTSSVGEALSLRIGINIGAVVAGVIGKTKFIYDLWGDTVNVASRMEVYGIPGEIQVTQAVYNRLNQKFIFAKRGCISIKGKGEMTTYLIKGKRKSD
ncbi:MAG: adenylate/guanylate cyclase domain-containing protein [Oscillatoria sp. PMC 1051.18]|nr:adenylate/guanylate cyclase domain-containing protein [Oscillatoria sp. PMC 1050.18]MEC5032284.1 adenylate/guanylate cyclase domain-containing protein [Oscillatoria sp. PMC 1051.18]